MFLHCTGLVTKFSIFDVTNEAQLYDDNDFWEASFLNSLLNVVTTFLLEFVRVYMHVYECF